MLGKLQKQLQDELANITDAGLFKKERIIRVVIAKRQVVSKTRSTATGAMTCAADTLNLFLQIERLEQGIEFNEEINKDIFGIYNIVIEFIEWNNSFIANNISPMNEEDLNKESYSTNIRPYRL